MPAVGRVARGALSCRGQGRAPQAYREIWRYPGSRPTVVHLAKDAVEVDGNPVTESDPIPRAPAQRGADRDGLFPGLPGRLRAG